MLAYPSWAEIPSIVAAVYPSTATQKITEFSYGVSDRGASIRIPVYTVEHDWNGYLEDRRPASNADPYKILAHIVGTLTK